MVRPFVPSWFSVQVALIVLADIAYARARRRAAHMPQVAAVLRTKELSSASSAGTKQLQASRPLAVWCGHQLRSSHFYTERGGKGAHHNGALPPDCGAVTRASQTIGRCRAITLSRGLCTPGTRCVSAALDLRAKCAHTDAAAAADTTGHVFGLARTWS